MTQTRTRLQRTRHARALPRPERSTTVREGSFSALAALVRLRRRGFRAGPHRRRLGCTATRRAVAWPGRRAPSGRLNLALQGGGAHGAFTWGVLDALLADPRIRFEGLSGSSAGAMNAVVLADGWAKGGRDGARAGLDAFWSAVGRQVPAAMVTQASGDAISLSPASKLMAQWAGHFSPSQLNPFDLNPLRDMLARQIDFERLRADSPFKLFVGTTHANSGKLRVFRERELSIEVLLASACLPRIHHAIEIDGEPYWDGGYSANPAVFPLFYECDSRDVLLVLLAPLRREHTPRTVDEIEARILELGFSANFMREMRMFALATDFARPSFLKLGRLERRPAADALPHDRQPRRPEPAAHRDAGAGARAVPRAAARRRARACDGMARCARGRHRPARIARSAALVRLGSLPSGAPLPERRAWRRRRCCEDPNDRQ
jgi:NTE family protein